MGILKYKKYFFLIIVFLFSIQIFAQQYGNEWINYGQQYFKIPVVQKGIYRITQPELQAAGFPTTIDPRKIQIYKRGIEQAINVFGETDGVLDASDFLEFYGEGNDGTLDSKLYIDPKFQVNKYFNLYSDTSAYFLTYRIDNLKGKRMIATGQPNTTGLLPVPYHFEQKVSFFTQEYAEGQNYPVGDSDYKSYLSQYDSGEGFVGYRIVVPTFYYPPDKRFLYDTISYTINNITNTYNAAVEPPTLNITLVGRNNLPHATEILVGGSQSSLRSLSIINYNYSETKVVTLPISWSDIVNGQLVVKFKIAGNNDMISVANILLTYPQTIDASNSSSKFINLPPDPSGTSYIEINNYITGSLLYDISDVNNIKLINTFNSSSKLSSVINGTNTGKNLYLYNGFLSVIGLKPINFRLINPLNHNFLIISHKELRQTSGLGYDAVKAYSDYRASIAGGNNDTITVNIDMLYNQFSYGEKSPLAIRHFADFMLQNKTRQLYMLLIGRGKLPFYARVSGAQYARDFIPPAGFPGSDVALVSGIGGNNIFIPAIPIGRLIADSPEEIIYYLNKVKEHEALDPQLWQKDLVHLSGGRSTSELSLFRSWVNDLKSIVEGKYFGGKVATISKKTDNPVELINVADQVNRGLSMITFFGHASPNIIDIDIGYCSNPQYGYNNKGKYPMILVNGCDAGDIFSTEAYGQTLGENWIKTPDKGCILFYAHSYIGYSYPLKTWADQLYNTFYADSIFVGKPIGVRLKETAKKYSNIFTPADVIYISNPQQYVLQGDPSISLTKTTKPDYAITPDKIFLKSFNNLPVSAAVDSFRVGIIVANLGKVDYKNVGITIRRTYSNGTFQQYDTLSYPPVFYEDTLYYTIKNTNFTEGGDNRFEIIIDPKNQIDELSKTNNIAILDYLMPTIGAIPLFPQEYSVVNKQPIKFIAQTTGIINNVRQFIMEIDTSYLFNSSAKRIYTTTGASLPTWDNISLISTKDSIVYYWRVRFGDIPEGLNNTWAESSFIFINNSPEGWSQSAYHQFIKAGLKQTVLEVPLQKWDFTPTKSKINVKVYGTASDPKYDQKTFLNINKLPVVFNGYCNNNVLIAVAFDKNSANPYAASNSQQCGPTYPLISNYFTSVQVSADAISGYIDGLKNNDYFVLFTNGYIDWPSLPSTTKSKLISVGADINNINKLKAGDPYIFLGRKNSSPGSAIEVLGDYSNASMLPNQQIISLDTVINGRSNQGTITSSLIGPASDWGNIWRNVLPNKNPSTGNWSLDLLGVDLQGKTSTILQNVPTNGYSINYINVNQYPYLRLKLNVQDTVNQVPPQLKLWQVIYKGVPEGIYNADLVPVNSYKIAEKMEGEKFTIPFVFQNISKMDFTDSLTVQATILNKTTGKRILTTFKIKKLLAGDTASFSIPIKTTFGSAGNTVLQVFVNPRILPEQNYSNNFIEIPFNVNKDNRNPLLEVTFDGIRIMNGDIVSPNPLVSINLKDDNKVQIRKDTVGMFIYLRRPCTAGGNCQFEKISLSSGEVKWTPAGPDNNFRMEYRPAQKLPNGIYTLKVQGSDVSGNLSGYTGDKIFGEPYQINFEVINESTVTHFYPYPNPFSTSTKFVFTLTGNIIPDQIKIQIMTVTGKVVREIMQDEIGPIKIGNNITQYAWTGTDEFGDKLANGVYLYRVIMRNSTGEQINHRNTSADRGFKKDFGKLYILR